MRLLPHPKWIPWLATALVACVAIYVYSATRTPTPQPGDVFMRLGLADATLPSTIRELAPGGAAELLISILAFDRLIEVDQVDSCSALMTAYDEEPLTTPIPLFLPGPGECFSYRLRYDIPIPGEQETIPLHLAIIHPDEDRGLLSKP